ncbi:MAG: thioredoxin [Sphingomonadales bacterium]|nr:thioredoxin [Sphingomonadales bacterium]MBU3992722.1 zinc-ribbon domain-containing protein [Alphaproteobacteria bacterium]
MIIACPACATRYVVPDSAIGVDGRTVRCAKCRHSWFQSGPELAPRPEPATVGEVGDNAPEATAQAPGQPETAAETGGATDTTAPAAEPATDVGAVTVPPEPKPAATVAVFSERRATRGYADEAPGADFGADFSATQSSFAHEPPFRPRRNRLKMYTIAAAVFAVVSLGAIGAVAWYGLPDWAPLSRQTFAEAQPDLTLEFPPNRQDRRTLPNGTEFFGASGKVTNIGKVRHTVPPILIVLRDSRDRIVYSWEVIPPKRQLAPGESVTINEAVTDVPRSAKVVEIGWKPS